MLKTPSMIAGVVMADDQDRFLLVQEGLPKAYGLWNLPAGHVDPGETPQAAAVREALEETGYIVNLLTEQPILVDKSKEEKGVYKQAFTAKIESGELKIPKGEILDARWFSFSEIMSLDKEKKLRSPWVFNAVKAVKL